MAKKKYGHSAYWLAKKEASRKRMPLKLTREFLAGKHRSSLVELALRMRRPGAALGVWLGILGTHIAVDTGIAVAHLVRDVSDPETRKRMKEELMRNLRIVRRPFYYAKEKERKRHLAEERRKVKRRKTLAPKFSDCAPAMS